MNKTWTTNRGNKQDYLLPLDIITKATKNDAEALMHVVNHYDRYINRLCLREVEGTRGNTYPIIDEEMKQRLQIRLVTAIQKFDAS
jgi:UTP-glucose-1-phosphate uridylyltransferase